MTERQKALLFTQHQHHGSRFCLPSQGNVQALKYWSDVTKTSLSNGGVQDSVWLAEIKFCRKFPDCRFSNCKFAHPDGSNFPPFAVVRGTEFLKDVLELALQLEKWTEFWTVYRDYIARGQPILAQYVFLQLDLRLSALLPLSERCPVCAFAFLSCLAALLITHLVSIPLRW